ncbi:hypothetical protein ACIPH4_24550 [Streptomyces tendae]|uniref:hypothetical protein n=1 Tax=Streptomyces tendae TaxID=1932 RepID=UPI0037FEB375
MTASWPSSGAGHLQRMANSTAFVRTQTAYRAYIGHTADCRDCGHEDGRCPVAEALWEAYKDANT